MNAGIRAGLSAPAGLLVGPALWAASTQASQILPYLACGSSFPSPALLAFPAALASLAAGWVSWRAVRDGVAPRREDDSAYPVSFPFVGRMAALAGPIFAYALVLQGVAGLVLGGCER